MFNTNPDVIISTRIEELKSTDPLIRAREEERLLAHYRQIVAEKPRTATNMFWLIKCFYRANYVALQCSDLGYTGVREQDYIPTKLELCKMCELLDLVENHHRVSKRTPPTKGILYTLKLI